MEQSQIITILVVALALGGTASAYYLLGGQFPFGVSGNTFNPEYPDPATNVLYNPVYAQLDCKDTGDFNSPQNVVLTNVPNCGVLCAPFGEAYFVCNNYFGCQALQPQIECTSQTWGCSGTENIKEIRLGSASGSLLSYPYQINRGDSYYFKAQCKFSNCIGYWSPNGYSLNVKGRLSMIYVDAHGYIPAGWLASTEGCKFVSAGNAQIVKNAQMVNANPLAGVDTIAPGVTKNVIVGWREDPTFGQINPQGKYQGRDVLCQNLAGIYGIKQTATVGGKTYWQRDSILVTYSGTNSMCCDNTGCATGYYCENYQCKANPSCTYGTCAYGDPSVCGNIQ